MILFVVGSALLFLGTCSNDFEVAIPMCTVGLALMWAGNRRAQKKAARRESARQGGKR